MQEDIKKPKLEDSNEDFNLESEDPTDFCDIESIDIDDSDMTDDVIEITEEDIEDFKKLDNELLNASDTDAGISKHKANGKHALKYDTIFKGKRDEVIDEEDSMDSSFNTNWSADVSTLYHHESQNNDEYIREKELKEKVYKVLTTSTNLDFDQNRRKPSRVDFNNYFFLLKTELCNDKFTNIQLFNELSFYFSDNLFNMFKLLDNKWRNLVISELQEHIGKINSDKTVEHRNIPLGSEIEFKSYDLINECDIKVTGEVSEIICDGKYMINSFENYYEIEICHITRILNNTKYKYNLNKLNNIDFL